MAPVNARQIGALQSGAYPAGRGGPPPPVGAVHAVLGSEGTAYPLRVEGAISNQGAKPAVTSLSTAAGGIAGGTSTTITGTGFDKVLGIKFGTAAAVTYTVNSLTSITVTSPAHAAGTADVVVTTAHGVSPVVAGDHFVYS